MSKTKLKMLYLVDLFIHETDEEHPLMLRDIIARLEAMDIKADRKTLYTDFEDLREYGYDIISEQRGRYTYYYLGQREYELPELKLLVDSVQAARFITTRKSNELIRKLESTVSRYQAERLHRQVFINGRIKTMNESIYYNIDRLHEAINACVQIRFLYGQWNLNKEIELRRDGERYQVSPWALVIDNERYYLVAYDSDAKCIKHYRVDKMQRIEILEAPRLGQETFKAFDVAQYTRRVFGMFTGEEADVTLEVENRMVGTLIDRFGKDIDIQPVDETHFQTCIRVVPSTQFIGWIAGLGTGVRIVQPDEVVDKMRRHLSGLVALYPAESHDEG